MGAQEKPQERVSYYHPQALPGMVLGEAHLTHSDFAPHFHLDYHIGLIADGVQRQDFSGRSDLLTRGRIAIMPPGEVHTGTREGDGGYTLRTFRLAPALLQTLAQEITDAPQRFECGPAIVDAPLLSRQLWHLHAGAAAYQERFDAAALLLLAPLVIQQGALRPMPVSGGLSRREFQRVRDYCYAHLGQPLSLQTLATLCGLSRFQFLRRFQQHTGMTPHAWLKRLRLEQACRLLSRPEYSVAQVAAEVGFYDQSHFSRAFRQAFAVAPSAW